MKSKKNLAAALAACASVFFLNTPVQAQDPTPTPGRRIITADSKMVVGGSFTLANGEVIEGDLAVFGGNVTLEEGSVVEGDVVVVGGNLDAGGVIQGDLGQLGGNIEMRDTVKIEGDVNTVGGNQTRGAAVPTPPAAPGAPEQPLAPEDQVPEQPSQPPQPAATAVPGPNGIRDSIRRAMRENGGWDFGNGNDNFGVNFDNSAREKVIPGALIITLLAMIAAALAPRNLNVAAQTLREQPWLSFGMGVLSLIGGAIVLGISLILIVTICISPLVGIAGVIAGWTVTSLIAGEAIARQVNRTHWSPLLKLAVGSLGLALLGAIPIVGDLLGPAFVALGLGALVLTRGGTRYYEPQLAARPQPSQIPPSGFGDTGGNI
jgi:hypothetical protein